MSEAPGTSEAPIHRREFDLLSEIVEIIMTIPGGLFDQQQHLSWTARETLQAFAAYRTGGLAALGIDPLWWMAPLAAESVSTGPKESES